MQMSPKLNAGTDFSNIQHERQPAPRHDREEWTYSTPSQGLKEHAFGSELEAWKLALVVEVLFLALTSIWGWWERCWIDDCCRSNETLENLVFKTPPLKVFNAILPMSFYMNYLILDLIPSFWPNQPKCYHWSFGASRERFPQEQQPFECCGLTHNIDWDNRSLWRV